MKTALVTGATGFVGHHLTRRLRKDGWKVFVLARDGSRPADLMGAERLLYDGSLDSVQAALAQSAPDVVFHLASLFISEHQPADVGPLVASNVLLGTQLAEAMTLSGRKLLVNVGTAWQNLNDSAYNPVNLYAATKQAFDDILTYYERARGLRVITLRIFDTYGPNDPRPKMIPAFLKNDGRRMGFSPGRQLIDLVHIDDVVNAFVVAAGRLLKGKVKKTQVYAVSSGQPRSLRHVAATFEKATGKTLPIDWGARPYRLREVMKPWAEGRRLPGWKVTISLEDGFRSLSEISPVTDSASRRD